MKADFSHQSIRLDGVLDIHKVAQNYPTVRDWVMQTPNTDIVIDLSDLQSIDSSGVVFLEEMEKLAQARNINLRLVNASQAIRNTQKTFSARELSEPKIAEKIGLTERLGSKLYGAWLELLKIIYLFADAFYFSVIKLFSKKGVRKGEFVQQCVLIGMNAFPIVALISFLIGFILALQSAAQLRQFGAAIYVADLVAISMTREMGPIMTAILFAGRSGSAIAAELATMVVTEETDALKAMGLNPVRYNLVPKIYAITAMMPLLTMLSMVLGIGGALLIGVTYLDVGFKPFFNQAVNALMLKDIVTGLIKSVVFAWLIVLTAASYGFRARGGAAEVGRATTASVVTSIFLVILADSILGLIFYFDTKGSF